MKYTENNTQFVVKYCTYCEKAWEKEGKNLMIHLGFPTYGLGRKTCSNCIKKQQRMEDFYNAEVYNN